MDQPTENSSFGIKKLFYFLIVSSHDVNDVKYGETRHKCVFVYPESFCFATSFEYELHDVLYSWNNQKHRTRLA